jgi:hypothetical protein
LPTDGYLDEGFVGFGVLPRHLAFGLIEVRLVSKIVSLVRLGHGSSARVEFLLDIFQALM